MTPGWHPFPSCVSCSETLPLSAKSHASCHLLLSIMTSTMPAGKRRPAPVVSLNFPHICLQKVYGSRHRSSLSWKLPGSIILCVFPGNFRNIWRMPMFLNPKYISADCLSLTPTDTNCCVFGDLVKKRGHLSKFPASLSAQRMKRFPLLSKINPLITSRI